MYEEELKIFTDAFNKILPGLQIFVRDVNLSAEAAAKYKVGIIIQERAFCDASDRVGGLIMTHRFAILSNHCLKAGQYVNDNNWGLHICQKGSFFKVIDVYEYAGRTQIALLHLLEEDWHLFQNVDCNAFDLVTMCRERFEKKCLSSPIPELATKEWLERCVAPVGLDGNNEFFPFPPKAPLMPEESK